MSRWHRRGDRPVDRAREVARTCWEALRHVDPDAADLIARAAHEARETWLASRPAQYQIDDEVTIPEAAELAGRSVRWVYQWVAQDRERRMILGLDGRMRVRVRDVLESLAQERRAERGDS